jgi:hypothetical protein
VTLELELSPSLDWAVTVNVCLPVVEVSIGDPDGRPFWSVHEEIPGPDAPSAQLKLEATDWPRAYTAPPAGTAVEVVGGEATA